MPCTADHCEYKEYSFHLRRAFPDLEDIIRERLRRRLPWDSMRNLKDKYEHDRDLLSKVTVEDLRKFGMIQ